MCNAIAWQLDILKYNVHTSYTIISNANNIAQCKTSYFLQKKNMLRLLTLGLLCLSRFIFLTQRWPMRKQAEKIRKIIIMLLQINKNLDTHRYFSFVFFFFSHCTHAAQFISTCVDTAVLNSKAVVLVI